MFCFNTKKKYKLTLHYFACNDGAGSAFIRFYESEKLARFVELCEEEPFGEVTYDSIVLKSNSPIQHDIYRIISVEDCIEDWEDRLEDAMNCEMLDFEREYAIILNMKVDKDNV